MFLLSKPRHGKFERKPRLSVPLLLLSLVFLGIALFSGWKVISILLEYRKGEQTYEQMQQHIDLSAIPTVPPQEQPDIPSTPSSPSDSHIQEATPTQPEEATTPYVSPVDFDALWQVNPDVVGWIYIEGTKINYPILQGDSNDTYLYHMIDGKYNRSGSIFMDYRNNADYSDKNTVLYGHHMHDDSMFAQIVYYQDQSFYEEHPTGYLFTPDRTYTLHFFTGFVTDMRDDAWQMSFPSEERYADWLLDAASRSEFNCGILPTTQDQILTLSTCTYEFDDARFILAAVMK